jgi:hypothetical protein
VSVGTDPHRQAIVCSRSGADSHFGCGEASVRQRGRPAVDRFCSDEGMLQECEIAVARRMREALPLMCTGHPAPHGRIPEEPLPCRDRRRIAVGGRRLRTRPVRMAAAPRLAQPGYPVKPIRLLVGYAPGGSADVSARMVAEALRQRPRPERCGREPAGRQRQHRRAGSSSRRSGRLHAAPRQYSRDLDQQALVEGCNL